MYVPSSFREDDPEKISSFIRKYSFGVLVSGLEGSLQASHLPFLLEEKAGSPGVLISHMAAVNGQGKGLEGREVVVMFQGPHAYISPSWYGVIEAVPTWNYTAVHVYGRYIPVTEEEETRQILQKMVYFYEQNNPKPWDLNSLPKDYFEKLLKMIAGFKIEITRWEGKWKLSQNHSEEKRLNVIQALKQGDPGAQAVAKFMEEKRNP